MSTPDAANAAVINGPATMTVTALVSAAPDRMLARCARGTVRRSALVSTSTSAAPSAPSGATPESANKPDSSATRP